MSIKKILKSKYGSCFSHKDRLRGKWSALIGSRRYILCRDGLPVCKKRNTNYASFANDGTIVWEADHLRSTMTCADDVEKYILR